MGWTAAGVRTISLGKRDEVIGLVAIDEEDSTFLPPAMPTVMQ
jgi:hypothetical protein